MSRIQTPTSVMMGTNCICSWKSNYHMITIMTTPLKTTEENNLKLQTLSLRHCFNIQKDKFNHKASLFGCLFVIESFLNQILNIFDLTLHSLWRLVNIILKNKLHNTGIYFLHNFPPFFETQHIIWFSSCTFYYIFRTNLML